eukprot:12183615-Heterocapsa_arctica.AAC.1
MFGDFILPPRPVRAFGPGRGSQVSLPMAVEEGDRDVGRLRARTLWALLAAGLMALVLAFRQLSPGRTRLEVAALGC